MRLNFQDCSWRDLPSNDWPWPAICSLRQSPWSVPGSWKSTVHWTRTSYESTCSLGSTDRTSGRPKQRIFSIRGRRPDNKPLTSDTGALTSGTRPDANVGHGSRRYKSMYVASQTDVASHMDVVWQLTCHLEKQPVCFSNEPWGLGESLGVRSCLEKSLALLSACSCVRCLFRLSKQLRTGLACSRICLQPALEF